MTQSMLTRITLALLMLLLVAIASFVFLFQGQQVLQDRLTNAQEKNDELVINFSQIQQELITTQATRDVSESALATAESDTIALESQLNESQQELEQLQGNLAEQETVLSNTRSELTDLQLAQQELFNTPPVLTIVEPADGTVFTPTTAIPIILVASDSLTDVIQIDLDITKIDLEDNGIPYASTEQDPSSTMVFEQTWSPEVPGLYVLSGTAVNANNITSAPISITVTITNTLP